MNFNTVINDFNQFMSNEIWNNYNLFRNNKECQLSNKKRRFQIWKDYTSIIEFMLRSKQINKDEYTYFLAKLDDFLFYQNDTRKI